MSTNRFNKSPIGLIQKELDGFEKNIKKSKEALDKGLITPEIHEMHKRNNQPNIRKFRKAIIILTNYL